MEDVITPEDLMVSDLAVLLGRIDQRLEAVETELKALNEFRVQTTTLIEGLASSPMLKMFANKMGKG